VQQLQLPTAAPSPATEQADPLGLGLGLGLGSDAIKDAKQAKNAEPGKIKKLLIRAEC
jgi:hypothetical protein